MYDNAHVYIILIINLPAEYEGMEQFMWEDKQVKQHYYETSSQKLSHTSCVSSCTLVCFIPGLSADMGATVIS